MKLEVLEIIDECEEKGKQITVSTEKLSNVLPLGPVIEPNGKIVLENGIEYIKKKSYIKK